MINKFSENSFIADFPIICLHYTSISVNLWIFPSNKTFLFWNTLTLVSLSDVFNFSCLTLSSYILSFEFQICLPITSSRPVWLFIIKETSYLSESIPNIFTRNNHFLQSDSVLAFIKSRIVKVWNKMILKIIEEIFLQYLNPLMPGRN